MDHPAEPVDRSCLPEGGTPLTKAEDQLRRPHQVLWALRGLVETLAHREAIDASMPAVVEQIGRTIGVRGVIYGRHRIKDDDTLESCATASWIDPSSGLSVRSLPHGTWTSLRGLGFDLGIALLMRDEIAPYPTAADDGPGARALSLAGIRSILPGPIFVRGQLSAGLAYLSDRPHDWSEMESESLRLLCHLLALLLEGQETQQALRQSEQRYRQVAEAATEYIWETDADGKVTYLSDRAVEVLGYPMDRLLGRTPFDLMVPEYKEAIHGRFVRLATHHLPFRNLLHRVISGTGELIWLSASGSPVLNEEGTLLGYRGTASDVTAEKRVEEILRESQERLAATQASMDDLLFTLDAEGRFEEYIQPPTRGLLLPPGQFVGKTFDQVLPPELSLPLAAARRAAADSGEAQQVDYGTEIDGARGWWSARISPRRDRDGNFAGVTIVARDVTEMRQAQIALQRRDQILETIQRSAEAVLRAEDWPTAVQEAMGQLGDATDADQVSFWRTAAPDSDGQTEVQRLYHWARPGHEGAGVGSVRLPSPLIRDIHDRIACSRLLRVPGSDLPAGFRSRLEGWGIKSLLVVPVQGAPGSWDNLAFTHLRAPHDWPNSTVDAIRTAGSLLGALLQRQAIAGELRESEEKYRSLVEVAAQPILIIDAQAILRFANLAAAEEFGRTAAELIDRTLWELFPAAIADRHAAAVRDVLASGRLTVRQTETTILGQTRWYEARMQPLRGLREIGDAVLLILTDITDRREGERRILDYQDRLRTLTTELTLAEARERRRIASGLHDEIGQTLAMARIELASARTGPKDPVIQHVLDLLDQTIRATRSLTFELSPPVLYELGLGAAIEWLLEQVEARHGIETALVGGDTPISLEGDFLGFVFRSVQELIVNVVKHARAGKIEVRLRRDADRMYIDIADDGIGFEPAQRRGGGFGLFSIRERLQHLGGGLGIESRPGHGTRCRIWVSVPTGTHDGEKESGT